MIGDYYRYTAETASDDKFENEIVLTELEFVDNQKHMLFLSFRFPKADDDEAKAFFRNTGD